MKHGRRPTRAQKMRLEKYNLNPKNWLVIKDYSECFVIINRTTGSVRKMQRSRPDEEKQAD